MANLDPLMHDTPYTRYVVSIVLAVCIIYDVLCVTFGWTTISRVVRDTDIEVDGLLRWLLLGLWFHWFVGLWPKAI